GSKRLPALTRYSSARPHNTFQTSSGARMEHSHTAIPFDPGTEHRFFVDFAQVAHADSAVLQTGDILLRTEFHRINRSGIFVAALNFVKAENFVPLSAGFDDTDRNTAVGHHRTSESVVAGLAVALVVLDQLLNLATHRFGAEQSVRLAFDGVDQLVEHRNGQRSTILSRFDHLGSLQALFEPVKSVAVDSDVAFKNRFGQRERQSFYFHLRLNGALIVHISAGLNDKPVDVHVTAGDDESFAELI